MPVRRRAAAILIERAAALAREGFFVESSALMRAAHGLMDAATTTEGRGTRARHAADAAVERL